MTKKDTKQNNSIHMNFYLGSVWKIRFSDFNCSQSSNEMAVDNQKFIDNSYNLYATTLLIPQKIFKTMFCQLEMLIEMNFENVKLCDGEVDH